MPGVAPGSANPEFEETDFAVVLVEVEVPHRGPPGALGAARQAAGDTELSTNLVIFCCWLFVGFSTYPQVITVREPARLLSCLNNPNTHNVWNWNRPQRTNCSI